MESSILVPILSYNALCQFSNVISPPQSSRYVRCVDLVGKSHEEQSGMTVQSILTLNRDSKSENARIELGEYKLVVII